MKKGTVGSAATEAVLILIRLYQHTFSSFFGPCCRFSPSCSAYAWLSVQRFGILDGAKLAFRRLVKCHPFNPGGYDPVPEIPKNS
jgi:putative membrane protein insertion efficiency factor